MLECILGSLRMNVEIEADASAATIRLSKSKVDAVIVDCDLAGSLDVVSKLQAEMDKETRPVLIISTSKNESCLEFNRAEFVVRKPISVEQAVHTLSAARNMILKTRLRYYRQNLDAPISITHTRNEVKASLRNLSQGGMSVHMHSPRDLRGDVGVHFCLPGTDVSLDAKGEVAWSDARGNAGIRLVAMSEVAKRDLQLWLERQYFQSSGA